MFTSQAEVKWVIRLQFVLLVVLLLGAGDFAVGSLTHSDPGQNRYNHSKFISQYIWNNHVAVQMHAET